MIDFSNTANFAIWFQWCVWFRHQVRWRLWSTWLSPDGRGRQRRRVWRTWRSQPGRTWRNPRLWRRWGHQLYFFFLFFLSFIHLKVILHSDKTKCVCYSRALTELTEHCNISVWTLPYLRSPWATFFLYVSSQVVLATSTPVTATEATTHTLKLTGGATRVPLPPPLTHPSFLFSLILLPFFTLLSAPPLSSPLQESTCMLLNYLYSFI